MEVRIRRMLFRRKLLALLRESIVHFFCIDGVRGCGLIRDNRTGYSAAKMPNDLSTGFALTASIPIPAIPTSFYPGATPVSALLG